MHIKKLIIPAILIISIGWFAFTPNDKYFLIAKNLDIFASMFKEVNTLYVDEVDPEKLVKTGIDAMLNSLDPYTVYIPEEDGDDFRAMTTGHYAGIGTLIGKLEDRIIVTMPFEQYAAYKAGIRVGDEILSVDGIPVNGMEVSEVSNLLKGQANSAIILEIKRYKEDSPITIQFERANIKVTNVPYYGVLENNIGYINLSDFTMGAGREVSDAVKALKEKGVDKLILDLRDNPGGLLNEAVNIVNLFIPKGKTVVETRGRAPEWNKTYRTLDEPLDLETPLIVLVNERSASASEIVSGAIQDYDRGILVGRKTYGKGLVQTSRSLSYNTQLKITTAKYYTPSGRCIQSIDYANRNSLGEGTNIHDSLKVAYQTINGRTVFDGEGLQPDILIEIESAPPVINMLIAEGYLFDYATVWHYENKDMPFAKDDAEFNKFVAWLKTRNFNYRTYVEEVLVDLKASAQKESYLDDIEDEISALELAVKNDKKNDLKKFKLQILELLEREIATRQGMLAGQITASFDDDPDILEAIGILQEKDKINQILSRN